MDPEFIDLKLEYKNMDRYVVRSSVLLAIDAANARLEGTLLDAGCGKMPYREYILERSGVKEYIGLDIESAIEYDAAVKPDHTWDGVTMPFAADEFDGVMATEVMEHVPNPPVYLAEVIRVLKPGGTFFFTVPFLWNLHEVPHDEYRYTPFAMERLLRQAGFEEIEIHAHGGWMVSFAQFLGMYAKRGPMSPRGRRVFSWFAMRFMRRLLKRAHREKVTFREGQMVNGLYGFARKPQNT